MSKFVLVLCACLAAAAASANPKIGSSLQEALTHPRPLAVDILITMGAGTESALTCMQMTTFATRLDKLNRLRASLTRHALYTQAPVTHFLESQGVAYTSFWISNQILVRDASENLINELAEFDQISVIHLDETIVMETVHTVKSPSNGILAEWGVEDVHAPEAWALGANGTGAIVAVIATGARATHEALAPGYMGAYGWFDPYGATSEPSDSSGLGTHALGVAVGSGAEGIGVAPGARWAACKGCDTVSCSQSALVACGQWVACPTLPDGSAPDCGMAPNVVINPWGAAGGGGDGENFYYAVLRGWQAVDILPVFGVGAGGGGCGSVGSPGDFPVALGVGAYSQDLTVTSAYGPAPGAREGVVKPDVVGPGANIRSASHTSDTGYVTLSSSGNGGSFAGGVAALLQGVGGPEGGVVWKEMIEVLTSSADPTLTPVGATCGGIPDTIYPNNVAGHGKLNARRAVEMLLATKD